MTLFENPIALEKTAEQLEAGIFAFQQRLLRSDIEGSGPFIGKPALTERDAFRELRESSLPDELKQAWLGWAFRFSEARVNGPYYASLAEAYRIERHLIDPSDTVTMTLRDLFFAVLGTKGQRERYLSILAQRTTRYRTLFHESWARRAELSQRAGFASLDTLEAPTTELETLAEIVLKRTSEPFAELVPPEVEAFFEAALAHNATVGFPAKLSARSMRALLGDDDWLSGLNPRVKRWVYPLSPTSFCRGLMSLGAALVDAAAPRNQPFVIARDPNGLMRRTVGALLGQLPSYAPFLRHRLNVSRVHATAHARTLTLSSLIHLRVAALSVLLRARLCRSRAAAESDYEALCAETFGFPLPVELLGLLPRVHPDAGQRLLGPLLANRLHHRLVGEFDEDWFRNPRGIESVRASLDQVPQRFVKLEEARTALEATLDDYLSRLS